MNTLIFILIPIAVFTVNLDIGILQKESTSDIKVVDFNQLQPMLQKNNDTVYVINFWATWCGPCIREIPYFEQLRDEYENQKLKILLVNLDMANDLESRVIPFVQKNDIKNGVILLDDHNSNRWIPLVDEKWTGAIPATLIYGNGFREFYSKEFTFSELDEIIQRLMTN